VGFADRAAIVSFEVIDVCDVVVGFVREAKNPDAGLVVQRDAFIFLVAVALFEDAPPFLPGQQVEYDDVEPFFCAEEERVAQGERFLQAPHIILDDRLVGDVVIEEREVIMADFVGDADDLDAFAGFQGYLEAESERVSWEAERPFLFHRRFTGAFAP